MAKAETKEYVVLKKGVTLKPKGDELKVGSTVKLTDEKAAALVNKVQLKSETIAAPKQEGVDELIKQLEAVTKERDDLQATLDEARDLNDNYQTSVGALTKERDDLVKAQVK